MARTYASAIQLLNSLQTNAAVLEALRKSGNSLNTLSLPEFRGFIQRIGHKPTDFDRLNIIHIAGTKGKGSTSAFCDSIMRQIHTASLDGSRRPLKTGLYSSPHLQEARERIRINGVPISREMFAESFFSLWDRFEKTKPSSSESATTDKPGYFRYLTLMAFDVFLKQNVDVVILEVGVGGEYDCTNVIERPIVCGISSLGYDHMSLLGNTIEMIARHKAGIIKPNVPVATVMQSSGAMEVIHERAKELGASKVIEITNKDVDALVNVPLGLSGAHQKINAALAKVLCEEWVASRQKDGEVKLVWDADTDLRRGLENARWPGRCQKLVMPTYPDIEWCIDGAHTAESLQACADWFHSVVAKPSDVTATDSTSPVNYLIFNCTQGRDGERLLPPLVNLSRTVPFVKIIFCSNTPFDSTDTPLNSDMKNHTAMPDPELKTQTKLASTWKEMIDAGGVPNGSLKTPVVVAGSVEAAIRLVAQDQATGSNGLVGTVSKRVLVTGSLHLLGSLLSVLRAEVS